MAARTPDYFVQAFQKYGQYPGIRFLKGVSETPIIRRDGTILQTPGYDPATGLIYAPSDDYPIIPDLVTQQDAQDSARRILDAFSEFPFASRMNADGSPDDGAAQRAAFLAAILTPFVRTLIDICPCFMLSANVKGAGKSSLFDTIGIMLNGSWMPRCTYHAKSEEMDKQMLALAIEGERTILFDNLATGSKFGNESLDKALTGKSLKGRILGVTKTVTTPIEAVIYATGNNVETQGDMARRVIPLRLESPEERPYRKDLSGCKIPVDIKIHVKKHRVRFVQDVLTILRAHAVAGWPEPAGLVRMSMDGWTKRVAAAVDSASWFL